MGEFIAYTDLAFSETSKDTAREATQSDIDAFLA